MKTFDQTKSYIIEEATKLRACSGQLNRAKDATTIEDLLSVVADNLSWVSENRLFNGQNIEEYFPTEKLIEFNLANTGAENIGFANTGYSNTGNRNTGAFCTGDAPFPMFNKPSNWTARDFQNSRAYDLLCQVDTKLWVSTESMTEKEKEDFPSHATTGGYLKDIPYKEAFQNKWHNWSEENRTAFTSLPNFDPEIFEHITGVKVEVPA